MSFRRPRARLTPSASASALPPRPRHAGHHSDAARRPISLHRAGAREERLAEDRLVLPFEGDSVFPVILSKAFLLAADDAPVHPQSDQARVT